MAHTKSRTIVSLRSTYQTPYVLPEQYQPVHCRIEDEIPRILPNPPDFRATQSLGARRTHALTHIARTYSTTDSRYLPTYYPPMIAASSFLRTRATALTVKAEATTQVKRNKNVAKLQAGYLFPEIAKRRNAHQAANPDAKIISLGIGDTTEPLTPYIVGGLKKGAEAMATKEGYKGYGPEQGYAPIREAIYNRLYSGMDGLNADSIYVSDGSKCDIGRMQMMFGEDVTVALQDPAYPVYVDSSVIMGMTGSHNGDSFDGITYLECKAPDFFPDLSKAPRTDIIFFCSPNNPTGSAATRQQLTELVAFAKKNGSIIVYDAAYALFIEDPDCPKTIFEIPGAAECAIETCSFSKYAGFTGVRLGWTVISDKLKFADGSSVAKDFVRIATTVFNGASVISQAGGIACMEDAGWKEMNELVAYYKENAKILKKTFQEMGFTVYGADNAPYVWVGFPGRDSWDVFSEILERCDIVTTPGSGFGAAGNGFVRASSFAQRENVLEAVERFKKAYGGGQ